MKIFERLGVFTYRYRWAVLVVWAVVLVASAFFAPNLSDRLKGGGFDGSGNEAERVQETMVDEFGVSPATLTIVFEGDGLNAKSDDYQKAEAQALKDVRKLDEVRFVTTYADTKDDRFISKNKEKSYAVIGFNVSVDDTRQIVEEVRGKVRSDVLTTYVTGAPAVYQDLEEASNEDIRQAEKYAFPFALLILIVAFGTLVAAGVPVLIGGVSVVTTLAILYFVAGAYDMSVFVLTLSTMLGLGLGIDYALFAVSRFREELESFPVPESVARTVATAGRSIFFSGTAVLIGLSGLLFFPFMFMRSIGAAGVLVVLVSVTAALTLLPAILGVLGYRINALALRRSGGAPGQRFWQRSAEIVMRRPVIVIVLVAGILGTLLYPVAHMKIGIPEASVLPTEYESRVGDDVLKKDFEYASLTPMEIISQTPKNPTSATGLEAIETLGNRIENTKGVDRVDSIYTVGAEATREYVKGVADGRERGKAEAAKRVDEGVQEQLDKLRDQFGSVPPGAEEKVRAEAEKRSAEELEKRLPELPEGIPVKGDPTPESVAAFLKTPEAQDSKELQEAVDAYVAGDRALLRGVTADNPYSEEARGAVEEVRAVDAPAQTSFLVGGLSAGQRDFISTVYGKAPLAVAFVLVVTYLVLLLTFRSVLLPLKAVIVNILSLSASFGAIVFVFQDGNLSGILNFTPLGFVDSTLPILLFSTIFGVSMDYEVFLLSRIREAYENGDSNTASVSKGLVSTAGIITSAAAIIIVVTGAFAFTGIILTKAVGLGLAVAVFVDATIIRVLLVPATMRVLGDWNWWPGGRKRTFSTDTPTKESIKSDS